MVVLSQVPQTPALMLAPPKVLASEVAGGMEYSYMSGLDLQLGSEHCGYKS